MASTVDRPGTDHAGGNGRARSLSPAERRDRSAHLVGVLARALTAQFDELARAGDTVPEGWWFRTDDGGSEYTSGPAAGAAGPEEDR